MNYYVLTSKKNKKIIVHSQAGNDCYDFIMKNSDAKIRKMDYHASPRIIDKRKFISDYYKQSGDEIRTFELADKMISGRNNRLPLISQLDLLEAYEKYNEVINKNL